MSDECRRSCKMCGKPFGPDRLPDKISPAACEECAADVRRELDEIEDRLEMNDFTYDIFTRCPEL